MYNEVLIECANLALFGLDDAAAGVIVGSIIGGIVNFVGSLINSNTTKKTNEKNIEVTQEENQVARDFEEEMYNKYESIPAQAQQYREAGVNPIQAVSPQSIGHASTSPMPQSQSPQYGNALIESFPAFLNAGTTLRQQRLQRQQEISSELDNWRQAFENGNAEELYKLNKEDIESRVALTRQDKKNREKELEQLDLTYRMAKEAYDKGINPIVDAHNLASADIKLKEAQHDSTRANINLTNAQTDLTKVQKDVAYFEFGLSKIYTEEFMKLDKQQREQEVKEYLDTSDVRISLFNVQKSFAKLAVDEATRQDVEAKLKHRANKVLLTRLAESAEDGGSFDTMLLKFFIDNPNGILDVLTSVSSVLEATKPSPVKIVQK